MIIINGTFGEGGGQILRSSLTLSLLTGKDFIIKNIRANRKKTGLLKQHLTAVRAAAEISGAIVEGDFLNSLELSFVPGQIRNNDYYFSVGTAGSTMLVLQTILIPLLFSGGRSTIIIEGGTHNPFAPPHDFFEESFLSVLRIMGAKIETKLLDYGFYPAGGGKVEIKIEPLQKLKKLNLIENKFTNLKAMSFISNLPTRIAQDELNYLNELIKIKDNNLKLLNVKSKGPGNVFMIKLEGGTFNEIFTSFGAPRLPYKKVVNKAVNDYEIFKKSGAAVCEHLADQLLIPFALAGGGVFRTTKPSMHSLTNIEVIKKFLDVKIEINQINDLLFEIKIEGE